MNILLIGNLCSGKTTTAKKVVDLGWCNKQNYFAIDDMRRKYSDGTYAGEFLAWSNFLETIQYPDPQNKPCLYEFSGTGKNAWFVKQCMQESGCLWKVVYCLCDRNELIKRGENRELDIPFPYKLDNLRESISFMSRDLELKYSQKYWDQDQYTIRTDKKGPTKCAEEIIKLLK